MLALSRSYVHLEYGEVNQDELDTIAEYTYESAETAASEYLEVRPVGVEVRVEEGSIDIIVLIGVYASALFTAISRYERPGGRCSKLTLFMRLHVKRAGQTSKRGSGVIHKMRPGKIA